MLRDIRDSGVRVAAVGAQPSTPDAAIAATAALTLREAPTAEGLPCAVTCYEYLPFLLISDELAPLWPRRGVVKAPSSASGYGPSPEL